MPAMLDSLVTQVHYDYLLRFVVAAVLGGCIGYEREKRGQAAGFRTNMLVAVGACLMMELSLYMEEYFRYLDSTSPVRIDPGRIASYAISSIGFVGGGAILKGKGSVRGLTTAASLWLVTGIGLAVGAGLILPSIAATVTIMLILWVLPGVVRNCVRKNMLVTLTVWFEDPTHDLRELSELLEDFPSIKAKPIGLSQDVCTGGCEYRFRLTGREDSDWMPLSNALTELSGVCKVTLEEAPIP